MVAREWGAVIFVGVDDFADEGVADDVAAAEGVEVDAGDGGQNVADFEEAAGFRAG